MQQSKKTLESQIAKTIADNAEKTLAAQADLEWWAALLECFYGSSPTGNRMKEYPLRFPNW